MVSAAAAVVAAVAVGVREGPLPPALRPQS